LQNKSKYSLDAKKGPETKINPEDIYCLNYLVNYKAALSH
jgi:hypothetical protein